MRLLVTGGTGLLGSRAVELARARGDHVVATTSRPLPAVASPAVRSVPDGAAGRLEWRRLDITDRDACLRVVHEVAPDAVLHTAYDYDNWAVTADGAAHVALAAAEVGARLVHVSSDAIFSGHRAAYDERCVPDPITAYGAAKGAAETAVRAVAPHAVVVRTSLILGPGSSMERRVHGLVAGDPGVLFSDDVRCPVHRDDLAAALVELTEPPAASISGIVHCAGADAMSRAELGALIAARDGLDLSGVQIGLRRDLPEPGPVEIRLDCSATQRRLRTRLRGAREFLS